MDTGQLLFMLKRRFSGKEYAFIEQVRDSVGPVNNGSRTADAIAISLSPSRGVNLYGFELKTSRGDWKSELKNPEKADAVAMYCDFWIVVVSDDSIVGVGELPPHWGLIVARKTRLVYVKEAQKLSPVSLDRAFIAAILKRAQSSTAAKLQIKAAIAENKRSWERQKMLALKAITTENNNLKLLIRQLEKASGIELNRKSAWELGRALSAVAFFNDLPDRLKSISYELGVMQDACNTALEEQRYWGGVSTSQIREKLSKISKIAAG